MKKSIRFIIVSLIIIATAFFSFAFTGCNESLDIGEAEKILAEGIEKALESDTYYIKYRINNVNSEEGKFVQYSLNVAEEKTAKFTVATGDMLKTDYKDSYYGKSLKEGVNKDSAKDSDYVTGFLESASNGKWNITPCTFEEFLTNEKISAYNMDSVTALLKDIPEGQLEIVSATRTGKVVYINVKVKDQNNMLSAYESVNIRVINGKLSYISDVKESFDISIAFGGPKITVPVWSATNEKGE